MTTGGSELNGFGNISKFFKEIDWDVLPKKLNTKNSSRFVIEDGSKFIRFVSKEGKSVKAAEILQDFLSKPDYQGFWRYLSRKFKKGEVIFEHHLLGEGGAKEINAYMTSTMASLVGNEIGGKRQYAKIIQIKDETLQKIAAVIEDTFKVNQASKDVPPVETPPEKEAPKPPHDFTKRDANLDTLQKRIASGGVLKKLQVSSTEESQEGVP